jgi:uncharacterized FAD-dependent dehydrogenase
MRLQLREIVLPLDHGEEALRAAAAERLRQPAERLEEVRPVRRSVDARPRRGGPVFVYTLEVCLPDEAAVDTGRLPQVEVMRSVSGAYEARPALAAGPGPERRPVVVGLGPAGLAAALTLAEAGRPPLVLERGGPVEERTAAVQRLWREGLLDPESNPLFGEGGAGLYSDGKLTARGKDRGRRRRFLQMLVEAGAAKEILIDAEPHLGSDVLARLCPALRRRLEAAGAEVRFGTRATGLQVEGGALRGVVTAAEVIRADACFLATGHSARDVYRWLGRCGARLAPKGFAVGLRLEMPQARIDRAQWGAAAGHPRLGAASFRLTRRAAAGHRACYTFCMCPGGTVMACASSPGKLTTNGMSNADRDGPCGNAAFLVPIGPEDAGASAAEPLAGIAFQERLEAAAFRAGGGAYGLPASPLSAFLAGSAPTELPPGRSCRRSRPADLAGLLPEVVSATLRTAVPKMLQEIGAVPAAEILAYGTETRTSSPVRVRRGEAFEAEGVAGLYPCGEGSGYAGGIVSSAVDGIRAAEAFLRRPA